MFHNIKSVIGQQVNEMKLIMTYCLPRLLYGCGEIWPIETVEMHKLGVIWNNGFRYIFNCCWRDSVKPFQFLCTFISLRCNFLFNLCRCRVLLRKDN